MRATWRGIAAALALTALVTGPAAPASAAPDLAGDLSVLAYASDLTRRQGVTVCLRDASVARTVTVSVTGSANRRAFAVPQGQACRDVLPGLVVTRPGWYAFTFTSSATEQYAATTVTRSMRVVVADVYAAATARPRTYAHRDEVVTVDLSTALGQRVALQRGSGGVWRTVATRLAPDVGRPATVRLPLPTSPGAASYRAVSLASPWVRQQATPTVRVHRTDYERHRAYIAKARGYMRTFCPANPIFVGTPEVSSGTFIGMAYTSWQSGGSASGTQWTLSTEIALRPGLSDRVLRQTALHECAHAVQARLVRADGPAAYQGLETTTRAVYGSPGVERQADCMAYAITRRTQELYYTKTCAGARLTSARAMWDRLGGRYQEAVVRWTTA